MWYNLWAQVSGGEGELIIITPTSNAFIIHLLPHGPDVNRNNIRKEFLTVFLAVMAFGGIGCILSPAENPGSGHPLKSYAEKKQNNKDSRTFNLATGDFDIKIVHSGKQTGGSFSNDTSQIGYALLCADLNGDHIEDIVVGAPSPKVC